MILADGARPDVFEHLIAAGRLPAINRYLVQRGSLLHGVTAFPSTTGPAYVPFLTGLYPGTANVPGIRWFDKDTFALKPWSRRKHRSYVGADSLLINKDLRLSSPSLFELCRGSINIFSSVNRGVSFWGNKTRFFRIWNWYYAHLTDSWALIDKNAGRKMNKYIKTNPEFMFVVYPGIDEYAHMSSPEHPATIKAYEQIDADIGRLASTLEQRGWLDDTVLMIVSDHGLSETKKHLGVNQLLEGLGIKTFFYPVVFKRGFQAASMVSGNGMSHLYFAKSANGHAPSRRDWLGVCYEDEMSGLQRQAIDCLREDPAIDVMVTRNRADQVTIYRNGQSARLRRLADGKIRYERCNGDPLDYAGLPDTLSEEEWLRATYRTDYPDAPVQLMQIIRSPRSGDIMLSARKGYDLRARYEIHEHKSTHGALHRDHMMIPIISSVPLKGPSCRSVDVFPTVCEWLGKPIPENIDGISRA